MSLVSHNKTKALEFALNKTFMSQEALSEETKAVMEELRQEGNEFQGDEPKDPEPETPKEQPEKETPPQEEEPKPKEETPKDEELPAERKPREIPAWKAEIEKKRLEKELSDKTAKEIESLRAEIAELKNRSLTTNTPKAEEQDSIKALADEYGVDEGFLRKLYDVIPKPEKVDVSELRRGLEEISDKERKRQEDYSFEQSFNESVVPLIKQDFPHASEDDIKIIKDKVKSSYFSEKYINLDANEVYLLQKNQYQKDISPPPKQGVEKGTKGVSRGEKIIDYDNLTEEDYNKLSDEEVDKVNAYLAKKQRG